MSDTIVFEIKPLPYYRATRRSLWDDRAKRYSAYKDDIQWIMKDKKFQPGNKLEIKFFVPFPKSWTGKKRAAMYLQPHQSPPDIDNYIKGLFDSLFENHGGDHTVYEIHAVKRWATEGYIEVRNL